MSDPLGGSWDAATAYDRMAGPRARVLGAPWPAVGRFLGRLPRGALVLDVGVGNGRYFDLKEARGLRWVGADVSLEQLRLARARRTPGALLVRADARSLPVADGRAEAALAVAVVHHLPTRGQRLTMLREVARCLRPGAPWLVSAWADVASFGRTGRPAPGGGPHDVMIPFSEGMEEPVERFFHMYGEGELRGEAEQAGLGACREYLDGENRFAEGGEVGEAAAP